MAHGDGGSEEQKFGEFRHQAPQAFDPRRAYMVHTFPFPSSPFPSGYGLNI